MTDAPARARLFRCTGPARAHPLSTAGARCAAVTVAGARFGHTRPDGSAVSSAALAGSSAGSAGQQLGLQPLKCLVTNPRPTDLYATVRFRHCCQVQNQPDRLDRKARINRPRHWDWRRCARTVWFPCPQPEPQTVSSQWIRLVQHKKVAPAKRNMINMIFHASNGTLVILRIQTHLYATKLKLRIQTYFTHKN